jgi:hypothetical protein
MSEQNSKKTENEFQSFKKKLLNSKHGFWFEVLDPNRKFKLFLLWKSKKYEYNINKKKPISFNKFMFNCRKNRMFYIPINLIRDAAINKILS